MTVTAEPAPTRILVLGASGLIGEAVAAWLQERGYPVMPVARRFGAAQKARFADTALEREVVDLPVEELRDLIEDSGATILVNGIGVLQDGPGGGAEDVHLGFAGRLVAALKQSSKPCLLVQVSMPGIADHDETAFSRSKRAAERLIAAADLPHVILRPGFVVAPAAFGGSALLRAIAMSPFDLPKDLAERPFRVCDVFDIARTIGFLAGRWQAGVRDFGEGWDIVERSETDVGAMVGHFVRRLGGPPRRWRLPDILLVAGCRAGDLAGRLGWRPPIRSTALAEMRRGIAADPEPWIAATGIVPRPAREVVAALGGDVQERWFARLYLLKGLMIPVLAIFWIASGLIALRSFGAARDILVEAGFGLSLSGAVTLVSSLMDIAVGGLIAVRRTCRIGLLAGIAVSLFYMATAAVLTPDMWLEPLGALVKTGPAIVLMMVSLAILEDR